MISKNKDVYNNFYYVGCDDYKTCAECEELYPDCNWFCNKFAYNNAEKLPMIRYEYQDDQK